MIPQYFKKDSRVWLHKNSKRKHPETELSRDYHDCYRREAGYEDDGWDLTPYITGADGKMYKKDSRTWLHKGSNKTTMKEVGGDDVHHAKPAKNPRRMWDVMKRVKELENEAKMTTIRAEDSNELIRGVINTGKRKKNNTRLGRGCGTSISHKDIHIVEEKQEVTFNPLINDKRQRFRFVKGSYSDQDNTYDDSSSDSDNDQDDDDDDDDDDERKLRDDDDSTANFPNRYAVLNCNGCDSLPLCRSNASIELSQEGLNAVWEIANQMHLQTNRRSAYMLETQDLSIMQEDLNPIDLSNGGMFSSRSSLNLCVTNLSEECVTAYEEVPSEESDYQLSEATQGLNVKSPTTNPPLTTVDTDDDNKIIID